MIHFLYFLSVISIIINIFVLFFFAPNSFSWMPRQWKSFLLHFAKRQRWNSRCEWSTVQYPFKRIRCGTRERSSGVYYRWSDVQGSGHRTASRIHSLGKLLIRISGESCLLLNVISGHGLCYDLSEGDTVPHSILVISSCCINLKPWHFYFCLPSTLEIL